MKRLSIVFTAILSLFVFAEAIAETMAALPRNTG